MNTSKESFLKLQFTLEAAGVGRWEWDIESNTVTWSDNLEEIHGMNRGEFEGTFESFISSVHPDDREQLQAKIQQSIDEDIPYHIEHRWMRSDGEIIWLEGKGQVIHDDMGQVKGMIGICMDITKRKQAELALRENEEKYRMLFDSMDEGFCIAKVLFDEDGKPYDYRFLEINSSFEKLLNVKGGKGKKARDLIPGLEDYWIERYGKVALTGEAVRFDDYLRATDSWFSVNAFRISDPNEHKVAILFNDITIRKQKSRTDAFLGAIINSTEDAIISKSLDGVIMSWNKAAERMFGYTSEEAIGQSITIIIPDERLDEEDRFLDEVRNGKKIDHFETIRQHKDGSLLDISLTISPIKDDEGKIIGASKIARDITEQKERNRNDALLGAIISNTDDAIVSKNLNSVIMSWNKAAERMFGYTSEEAIGQSITMIIPKSRLDEEDEIIGKIKEGKRTQHFETKRKRKDGSLIDVSLTISPIKDDTGQIFGASKIARDITEQKRTEKKLKELNETLEERVEERTSSLLAYQKQLRSLAMQLSKTEEQERHRLAEDLHDNLGQLLAVCKMKVSLMQKQEKSSDLEEVLELVDDAIVYTRELMSDLKPPSSLDDENLKSTIEWVAERMEKHNLEVEVEEVDDQPKPLTEEVESTLLRSTRELLFNVVKHAGVPKAMVTISRKGDQVMVTVEDKGPGFNPDERNKKSLDKGFGLFSIYERMDFINGNMEIESEPGKGTKVTLIAPLLKGEENIVEKSASGSSSSGKTEEKIKILIVDDHQIVREGLRKRMEEEDDLTVIAEASDGEEALKLAKETSPDIIVMDVSMPMMDGIIATQKIKDEFTNIRVIGLSSDEDEEFARKMLKAGASAYLVKSEAFETLSATIRSEVSAEKEE